MKIQNCLTKEYTDVDSGADFGYMPGMAMRGMSKGSEFFEEKGISAAQISTGTTLRTLAVAIEMPEGQKKSGRATGLTIGCSHGCAPSPRRSVTPLCWHSPFSRWHTASLSYPLLTSPLFPAPPRHLPLSLSRSTPGQKLWNSYHDDDHDHDGVKYKGIDFGHWFGPMDRSACDKFLRENLLKNDLGPKQSKAAVSAPATVPLPHPVHGIARCCSHSHRPCPSALAQAQEILVKTAPRRKTWGESATGADALGHYGAGEPVVLDMMMGLTLNGLSYTMASDQDERGGWYKTIPHMSNPTDADFTELETYSSPVTVRLDRSHASRATARQRASSPSRCRFQPSQGPTNIRFGAAKRASKRRARETKRSSRSSHREASRSRSIATLKGITLFHPAPRTPLRSSLTLTCRGSSRVGKRRATPKRA